MRAISRILAVIAISASNFHCPISALSCYVCRYGTQDFEASSNPGCGSNIVDTQYLQNVNGWNYQTTMSLEDQHTSETLSAMGQILGTEIAPNATTSIASSPSLGVHQHQTHPRIVTSDSNSSTFSLIHYGCAKLRLLIKSPRRSGTLILRSGVWTLQRDSLNTCSETNAKILIATNPNLLTLKPYIQEQTTCFCDVNGCNSASGLSAIVPIISVGFFLVYHFVDKFCFYGL